jgi:hypothetical protein
MYKVDFNVWRHLEKQIQRLFIQHIPLYNINFPWQTGRQSILWQHQGTNLPTVTDQLGYYGITQVACRPGNQVYLILIIFHLVNILKIFNDTYNNKTLLIVNLSDFWYI